MIDSDKALHTLLGMKNINVNDRNQHYGYGKINVANLIDNINDIQ
jgi:hypothetical protein